MWGSRFKEWAFSPLLDKSRGLAILWNSQSIYVTDSLVGEFLVSIKIAKCFMTEWWLFRIYRPCMQQEREILGRAC